MAEEQVDQKPKLNISIVYEGTREYPSCLLLWPAKSMK